MKARSGMKFNPLKKIRLLKKKNLQEPFLSFQKILGFPPNDIELYKLAVTHRSAQIKSSDGQWINNERLEFLGDAVLNLVVADVLYHNFEKEDEGFLTNARANIVKRESLNKICRDIGLDRLMEADEQLSLISNTNILGNAMEAFVGAVYLDVGYEKCTEFVKKRMLITKEWILSMAQENENFKSELLEWCQQRYLSLDFVLLDDTVDKNNQHTFTSQVLINEKPICTGTGSSKKESHQQASYRVLKMIDKHDDFLKNLG